MSAKGILLHFLSALKPPKVRRSIEHFIFVLLIKARKFDVLSLLCGTRFLSNL